jgi:acyl-CoA thioester hydrolase
VRSSYRWFSETSRQWRDDHVDGHVNSAVHHTWFDSAVDDWRIERELLTIGRVDVVGLVVANACQYIGEVAFAERVQCGLRAGRIGTSSGSYKLGLFRGGWST